MTDDKAEATREAEAKIRAFVTKSIDPDDMVAIKRRFDEYDFYSGLEPLTDPFDYDDMFLLGERYILEIDTIAPPTTLLSGYRNIDDELSAEVVRVGTALRALYQVFIGSGVKVREYDEPGALSVEYKLSWKISDLAQSVDTISDAINILEEEYEVAHNPEVRAESASPGPIRKLLDNEWLKILYESATQRGGQFSPEDLREGIKRSREDEERFREIGLTIYSDEQIAAAEKQADALADLFPDHEALITTMRALRQLEDQERESDNAILRVLRKVKEDLVELNIDLAQLKPGIEGKKWVDREGDRGEEPGTGTPG